MTSSSPPVPRPSNATSSPFFSSGAARGSKRLTEDSEAGNYIFGDLQKKKPRLGEEIPDESSRFINKLRVLL